MSLSKSKCWYSNNCLHFKSVVFHYFQKKAEEEVVSVRTTDNFYLQIIESDATAKMTTVKSFTEQDTDLKKVKNLLHVTQFFF